MLPRKIFLARHGESEWNASKRISGQGNPPLSRLGVEHAHALAKVLRTEPLTAIYTSTLQRSLDTAKPTALAHVLPIRTLGDLQEISLGALQGRYRDERDPEAQSLWARWQQDKDHTQLPGGETFLAFEARVRQGWQTILQENAGSVLLIVGHRSTNRVILNLVMRWPRTQCMVLPVRNKYLYEITPGAVPQIATIRLDVEKIGYRYAEFRI